MKESIHKYFQVGTIQWMSFPKMGVLESMKRIAADDYFDAVEITQCKDDAEREEVKKMLAQSHLKVCYGAQPRLLGPKLNPNALDENERRKAEATLLEAIDEAEYLGAEGIAFLAGKWEEKTKEQAYQQLLMTTRNLCNYAPYAARFAADVRMTNSNFGLLVDLSHFPTTYETSTFVIQTLRPYITHLHFGNAVVKKGCTAYGDKHPRFGFPESAHDTAQLLDYLKVLKQEGFFRSDAPFVLSMEVAPVGEEDEEIVLANTKRVLNRAWALLED